MKACERELLRNFVVFQIKLQKLFLLIWEAQKVTQRQTHTHTYTHVHETHADTHIHTYTYTHVHVHETHADTHTQTHTYTYTHKQTHTHKHIHTHTDTHTKHSHIHTRTRNTRTHTPCKETHGKQKLNTQIHREQRCTTAYTADAEGSFHQLLPRIYSYLPHLT